MKASMFKYWEALLASYWFIPLLMSLGAIVLAIALPNVDQAVGSDWIYHVGWLYPNNPEGARTLLSTIAGSMITVAGVVFSITLLAVSYATREFGPRLLTNFMRDKANQVTLGTFIATFLYCLLVLRTIQSSTSKDVAATAQTISSFVPHIATLSGLVFALASVGVLIFYIHHMPESIHVANVTSKIGLTLHQATQALFPEMIGEEMPAAKQHNPENDLPETFDQQAVPVPCTGNGYLQYIDGQALIRTTRKHDLLLRINYRPGDFVNKNQPLVYAWPQNRVNKSAINSVNHAFVQGRQRTYKQDLMFLVNELIEIAARALSPGTNDPFTATTCIDWLGNALISLSERHFPHPYRYDNDGQLRVITQPVTLEDMLHTSLSRLRPYAKDDRNAALHLMHTILKIAEYTSSSQHREVLLDEATTLKEECDQALSHAKDRKEVGAPYRKIVRLASV